MSALPDLTILTVADEEIVLLSTMNGVRKLRAMGAIPSVQYNAEKSIVRVVRTPELEVALKLLGVETLRPSEYTTLHP